MKRKFSLLLIVILFIICQPGTFVCAKEGDLRLYSTAAVLMDADSGRVLYSKNENQPLAMASTTKIMTLIVTLENANLEDEVEVTAYAASMPDVQLNIRQGEKYRLKDLTYSLMLESHNDSAVAIAEHVAGSVEEFSKLMNNKAEEIGCEDTFFVTPNGLDSENHHTTAKDLGKIMSYCVKKSTCKDKFLEITRTGSYSFSDLSGKRSFTCNNHNAFLHMMEGALSGKTGFTSKAGYCYVGALESEDRTFVVALLGCGWPSHKTYKWSDTKALMTYGKDSFRYQSFENIPVPEKVFEKIHVNNAKTKWMGQTALIDVEIVNDNSNQPEGILISEDEKVEVIYRKLSELDAPVKKGQIVGKLCYLVKDKKEDSEKKIKGEVWKSMTIVSKQNIEKIDYIWCLKLVFKDFLLHLNGFYVNVQPV